MDLNTIVNGITLEKACSIKADKDSSESKSITLKVLFNGVTLKDVFAKAVSSAVIQWQNGPGRTKFTSWTDKQVVSIDFKAPGANIETREDKIAKLVANGFKPEVATYAIDNPEKYAAIVNANITIPLETEEDLT